MKTFRHHVQIVLLCVLVAMTALVFGCKKECEHTHCEWVVLEEATCSAMGKSEYVCQDCGIVLQEKYLPKNSSHSYGEWGVDTEATCVKKGSEHRICTVCGHEEKKSIAATGHEWSEWVAVSGEEIKCSFYGEVKHTCAICGEEETDYLSVAHQWGEYQPDEGAVCNTICDLHQTCELCGARDPRVFTSYLYHSYKDGFCIYCNQKEPEAAGQEIEFGAYPQSQVTDETSVTELNKLVLAVPNSGEGTIDGWTSFRSVSMGVTEYLVWYQDVSWNDNTYRAIAIMPYPSDGEQIDALVSWFKWEPLKWTVVENFDDHMVLMCKSIIDVKPMNEGAYGTWPTIQLQDLGDMPLQSYYQSDLNVWLNDSFYNMAFSTDEKAKILKEEHQTIVSDWEKDYVAETYVEYIYIPDTFTLGNPNYKDIILNTEKDLCATDYAVKRGGHKVYGISDFDMWRANFCNTSSTETAYAYYLAEGTVHFYEDVSRGEQTGIVPMIIISK